MNSVSVSACVSVEPWAALQARYPAALRGVYDQQLLVEAGGLPSDALPLHVFDTPTGLRFVILRTRTPYGRVLTHVSVSRFGGTWAVETVAVDIAEAFATIARTSEADMQFIGFSDSGVLHFLVETPTVH